jgi:hypothetical protein
MSDAPVPQPQHPAQLNVSGSGNIINYGGNIASHSETRTVTHWYFQHMSEHKAFYWILHFIIAMLAAAAWEYGGGWIAHHLAK